MRQFDTLQSYMDNDGCPLVGRARFCKDEGGELKAIMDCDGNLIDSIVFTDASGRLSRQVFLDDSDYYVFFDRYDGNANPFTDDDDDSWSNQFSVKNLYNTFNIVVDTEGEQCVATMEDLRRLDPIKVSGSSVRKFVRLLGYYEPGDKESVNYYWDHADTSSNDDGGSVVKVEGIEKGRWKIVYGSTTVDVRHFGAFPTSVANIDSEQSNCIYNAVVYANSHGLRLFFPSVGNEIYYDVSGRTLSRISMSDNARLFCKSGNSTDIYDVESVFLYADKNNGLDGTINVRSEILRSSYNTANYDSVKLIPSSRIILDSQYPAHHSLKDLEVFMDVDQRNPIAFTRCKFSGDGKFVENTNKKFYSCEIRESMFAEDYDYELTEFHECESSYFMWEDIENFATFCMKNKSKKMDFNNVAVRGNFDIDWDCSVSNAKFLNLYVGNGVDEEKTVSVNMDNVNLRLRKDSYFNDFVATNVTTEGNSYIMYCNNVMSTNSTFSLPVFVNAIKLFTSAFSVIQIENNLSMSSSIISSSVISNAIQLKEYNGAFSGIQVTNCTFSGYANVIVVGSSSGVESATIKDSMFIGNALMGAKRDLITGYESLNVIIDDSCYIMGNANAYVEMERSDVNTNVFNRISVEDSAVVNKLRMNLAKVHFDTDLKKREYLSSDGSIFFTYDEVFDNDVEKYVPRGPAKMSIKINGEWIEVG